MAETNFRIFNEENAADKTYNDSEYEQATQRLGGVTPGMALSRLHNKLYLQTSVMAKAIADFLVKQGYDCYDNQATDITANLENAIKAFNASVVYESITAHNTDTDAHEDFVGATASAAGMRGMVPAPPAGAQNMALMGDGTYAYASINLLQRNKAYAVGDIAYSPLLPSWARLECIAAGTTGAEDPEILSTTPMDNSKIGTYIADGTVVWVVDDIRDGTPIGGVRGSLYLPKGYIKANGATVNRVDYPRLVNFIETNNLWTDDTEGNLGLFGKGDGDTTFVLPNYAGRMMTYKDAGVGQTIAAGIPEIAGTAFIVSGDNNFSSTGAFNFSNTYPSWVGGSGNQGAATINFSAKKYNAIFGASDTVQPPAIALIPVIRY